MRKLFLSFAALAALAMVTTYAKADQAPDASKPTGVVHHHHQHMHHQGAAKAQPKEQPQK